MLDSLTAALGALPEGTMDTAGLWLAALLTLAVLSYVFGENPAFRLAEHLFVGVAAGYAASLAWTNALKPRLALLLGDPVAYWYYGVFFILGVLLLFRGIRPLHIIGNLPLGVLFGIGAAIAIGGALTGSLIPQMGATISVARVGRNAHWTQIVDAVLLILGTVAVLSAFHYTAERGGFLGRAGKGILGVLGGVGRQVIMIAFGALLAGAIISFFAVLQSRVDFILYDWIGALAGLGT